ncbi:hypothetical protein APHAL10511_008510 [Amanita phalloides]|nr:hypothetical protein APHAL10511_008510 [Amanita phalloides]
MIIDSKPGSGHPRPTTPGSRNSNVVSGGRERNSENGWVRRNNTIGGGSGSYYSRSSVSTSSSSDSSNTSNRFDPSPPPYDAPPPAYSLHDESPRTGDRSGSPSNVWHDVPRSFEGGRPPHDGRGHGRPGPESSSPASVGTPPASALPKNGVSVHESNSSIRGCYIIDPEKDFSSRRGGKNLDLNTSNGSIDVDVAILPPARMSRNHVDINLHSSCGSINLRMHDTPTHLISSGRENRGQQRPMIVYAHSSNGKVHICIPRSFHGLISTTTHNGNIKFSEGIQANMTTMRRTNFGSRNAIVFIGDPPEGIPALSADESDSDGHFDESDNVFIFNETHIPGRGGFFNGARNFTVHGASFNFFPGDATIVQGASSSGSRHGHPRRSTESSSSSSSSSVFENAWQGHRVTATSSNGNIQIAYDDEHAFDLFGGWKQQSSEGTPRRRQTTLRNVYIGGNRIDLGGFGMAGLF